MTVNVTRQYILCDTPKLQVKVVSEGFAWLCASRGYKFESSVGVCSTTLRNDGIDNNVDNKNRWQHRRTAIKASTVSSNTRWKNAWANKRERNRRWTRCGEWKAKDKAALRWSVSLRSSAPALERKQQETYYPTNGMKNCNSSVNFYH